MARLSEPELRAALERTPQELHPLLIWLVTGRNLPATSTTNGTVTPERRLASA